MEEFYAKKIEEKVIRRPYADTYYLDIYESNCETIEQFVELLKLTYPAKEDRGWWECYINNITKKDNRFVVETISPFTD